MSDRTQEKSERDKLSKQKLTQAYKDRGFQTVSYSEFEALKTEKAKRAPKPMPKPIKLILQLPFYLIGLLGLLFIPRIIYQIVTSPVKKIEEKKEITYGKLMKKSESSKSKSTSKSKRRKGRKKK